MIQLLSIVSDEFKLFKMELIDADSFFELLVKFTLNTAVLLFVVRWLYYTSTRRKDYLFTFMLIGTIVFLLCYMLGSVKIKLGFALGLFAIFGIIRYRTDQIPIKEMTYLFLVVAISAINALVDKRMSIAELLFSNGVILFLTYGFEKLWLLKHDSVKDIVYEKIDLIKPEKYSELVEDIRVRTGLRNIIRVEVGKIDFLRDTCRIKVYYEEKGDHINMADNQSAFTDDGGDD